MRLFKFSFFNIFLLFQKKDPHPAGEGFANFFPTGKKTKGERSSVLFMHSR